MPHFSPLNFAHTGSLGSTENNPFRTSTNFKATACPCQTLDQPHTIPKLQPIFYQSGPTGGLPSSPSVPTVNQKNFPPVDAQAQNCSVSLVAMNKSINTFEGLDQQNTPETTSSPNCSTHDFYYERNTSLS